jgi:predicted nucleic acid-binding protein
MKVFIDSNIPMYVAGAGHENRELAVRFLEKVEKREVEACTSTAVLEEILSRYAGLGRRDLAGRIYDLFVEACPEVLDITVSDTDRCRILIGNVTNMTPRHAIHTAVMLNRGIEWIATFDKDFDKIAGIRRLILT